MVPPRERVIKGAPDNTARPLIPPVSAEIVEVVIAPEKADKLPAVPEIPPLSPRRPVVPQTPAITPVIDRLPKAVPVYAQRAEREPIRTCIILGVAVAPEIPDVLPPRPNVDVTEPVRVPPAVIVPASLL